MMSQYCKSLLHNGIENITVIATVRSYRGKDQWFEDRSRHVTGDNCRKAGHHQFLTRGINPLVRSARDKLYLNDD